MSTDYGKRALAELGIGYGQGLRPHSTSMGTAIHRGQVSWPQKPGAS